jgi:SAM-dependent methyltransferase
MSFAVTSDSYDRFMGRYSAPLAPAFVDFARIPSATRLLDVGCGTGALVTELLRRPATERVVAVDPSDSFVAAMRERHPDLRVEQADAEHLPFDDGTFDASLAQLVVHFMPDPVAGIAGMRRVTRPGGIVAACVWDHAEGGGPLTLFWDAVHDIDPTSLGEATLPGTRRGDLRAIFGEAGMVDVDEAPISVTVQHSSFEEWWEPFTLGVGPAGAHVSALTAQEVDRLRERCRERHPGAPFDVTARAWAARGTVPDTE